MASTHRHESVNHSVAEYVRDQAYTNGMESFWSMLKCARRHAPQDQPKAPEPLRAGIRRQAQHPGLRNACAVAGHRGPLGRSEPSLPGSGRLQQIVQRGTVVSAADVAGFAPVSQPLRSRFRSSIGLMASSNRTCRVGSEGINYSSCSADLAFSPATCLSCYPDAERRSETHGEILQRRSAHLRSVLPILPVWFDSR